jgi:hypothetical protein
MIQAPAIASPPHFLMALGDGEIQTLNLRINVQVLYHSATSPGRKLEDQFQLKKILTKVQNAILFIFATNTAEAGASKHLGIVLFIQNS